MKATKLVFAALFTLVFLVWGVVRIVNGVVFTREIGGYLKRAADSNTIELAAENLKVSVRNINANRMVSGYTSILYRTPDEDVGFWHDNLEASLKELQSVRLDASQLERSNVLIKLRETLLDHKEGGVSVTSPSGISIYPNNTLYAFWGFGSLLLAGVFWVLWVFDKQYRNRSRYH